MEERHVVVRQGRRSAVIFWIQTPIAVIELSSAQSQSLWAWAGPSESYDALPVAQLSRETGTEGAFCCALVLDCSSTAEVVESLEGE